MKHIKLFESFSGPQHEVEFKGYKCVLDFGTYMNGNVAIQLIEKSTGEPVAVATINPTEQLPKDEVIIKDYSENEGMVEALVNAGIIELTGKKYNLPYAKAPMAKIVVDYKINHG